MKSTGTKRRIIEIDQEKCSGCGQCIPDCPEGALQLLEGKARLVSDLFCDGLGACIGACPEGAISVVEREAGPYDERAVMEKIVPQGEAVIRAHLEHLLGHGERELYRQAVEYLGEKGIPVPRHAGGARHRPAPAAGCPGSAARSIGGESRDAEPPRSGGTASELRQWPVQLRLLNPAAPYFENADLLIVADCVPFAYADFHRDFLRGRIAIVFCPKLDEDIEDYIERLADIFTLHTIRSITVLHMEVPCCSGVNYALRQALERSGRKIPITEYTVRIQGGIEEGGPLTA